MRPPDAVGRRRSCRGQDRPVPGHPERLGRGRYGAAMSDESSDEPTHTSTKSESLAREVAGRTIDVSNPDKVFFAGRGDTKLDLIEYYLAVEEPILAAMGGRPVLLQRFPNGAS